MVRLNGFELYSRRVPLSYKYVINYLTFLKC